MKQFLAFLLAAMMLVTCFACSSGDKGGDTTTAAPGGTTSDGDGTEGPGDTSTPGTTEVNLDPGFESQDFGGEKIIFLTQDRGTNYQEFGVYEDSANNVTSAVFWRNFDINEKYNVEIQTVFQAFNTIHTYASSQMASNDTNFDVINCGYMYQFALSQQQEILNIKEIPHVDTTKTYWNQSILENTSIGFENYFMVSDMNIWTLNAVGVVFFNVDLVNDLQFDETPYELVLDDRWTYDKMFEMSKLAYEDDGDSVVDIGDRFGSVSTNAATETMFAGLNGMTVIKDANDIPVLNLFNETTVDIIDKIVDFWADDSSLHINRYPNYESPNKKNLLADTLLAGKALFSQEQIYQLTSFADSDYIIGMVPCPKYDEEQEDYWTFVHMAHGSAMSIPITIKEAKLDHVGMILEDMAYLSYVDVRPAYYDVNLKARRAQDDESREMLDIIYSHIRVDIGILLQLNGIDASQVMRTLVFNKETDIVSAFDGKETIYQGVLDEMLAKFKGEI